MGYWPERRNACRNECSQWVKSFCQQPTACPVQCEGFVRHQGWCVLQVDCEAHLWQHCPQTVHSFAAFAQQQDAGKGAMPNLLKWQSILVRPCCQLASLFLYIVKKEIA